MLKKTIIRISYLSIMLTLILSSCSKTNVRFANNRIIGTWTLSSEKSTTIENSAYNYSYTPANTCYENSSQSYSQTRTTEITGNTVHSTYSYSSVSNGETDSESMDTTYTADDSTFKIIFNEDGTCVITETYASNEDNYSSSSQSEYTCYWNWLDSYKEKTAIVISATDSDYETYDITFYIESLTKDELTFSYNTESKSESESTYEGYSSCWNSDYTESVDITRYKKGHSNTSESGTRVMTKSK